MRTSRWMVISAIVVVGLMSAITPVVRADFRFKVINNTSHTIVHLLVSEHGEEASEFDIGKGIGAGRTETLVWDRSTDKSNCEWAITAVYSDGTYSDPVTVNFCEPDLELVFDE